MKKLAIAAGCLLVGGSGCAFVLMHIDHASRFSNGQTLLLLLMFGSLLVGMAGFVAFLSWRDDYNALGKITHAEKPLGTDAADGLRNHGVYGLWPGVTYQVIKAFKDHYGAEFSVGERLTYIQRNFLPYHGGYTLSFEPRAIYLQEEVNADILQGFAEYLAIAEQVPVSAAPPKPEPEPALRVLRQDRYSSTEMIYLEITATCARTYLNSPTHASLQRWTFEEVLAGKADASIQRNFGDEALAELKSAIRSRPQS